MATQITSVNQVPAVNSTTDAYASANQSQSIRSGYVSYLQNPVSGNDTAIRQQYISNIATSDNQTMNLAVNLPASQQNIVMTNLKIQAYETLETVTAGITADIPNYANDADENAASDQYETILNRIKFPIVFNATTNGTGSTVPTVSSQSDTTSALAQSQNLRNSYQDYLSNPVSDPSLDASLRTKFNLAIDNADNITVNLANASNPQNAVGILTSLVDQATKEAQSVYSNPNSTSTYKSNATGTLMFAQGALQNSQNNVANTPAQNLASTLPLLSSAPQANSLLTAPPTNNTSVNNAATAPASSILPTSIPNTFSINSANPDTRVRLLPKIQSILNNGILRPLAATNGLMFPYTPTIQFQAKAAYSSQSTTHANQDYRAYVNTPAMDITVAGPFTAQNHDDAEYMIAALHFLRTVTKMHFGNISDPALGLPPPVLTFNAYGKYMFNNLPVIVTGYNMTFDKNVDYITINVSDNAVSNLLSTIGGYQNMLPVLTEISVNCTVQTTPQFQRTFDWNSFASGQLMITPGTTPNSSYKPSPGGWF